MAKEDEVLAIMDSLKIATKHDVAAIMAARGHWKEGDSATNNSYKALSALVEENKLEKFNGWFRVPGCKSEGGIHSELLTKALVEFLKLAYDMDIKREHMTSIATRPDALILAKNDKYACCIVLEIAHHETDASLDGKVHAWLGFEGALDYLSEVFGEPVDRFYIVVGGETDYENPNCFRLPDCLDFLRNSSNTAKD